MEDLNNQNMSQMEEYGSFNSGMQAFVKSIKAVFFILTLLVGGMVIYYFTLAGGFTVSRTEWVLVSTFGKLNPEPAEEGWNYGFPVPISERIRLPKGNLSLTSNKFWRNELPTTPGAPQRPTASLNPEKDGYNLTGDANIIHSSWKVEYKITDPVKYYLSTLSPRKPVEEDDVLIDPLSNEKLGTRGPRTLVNNILDSSVIFVAAQWKAQEALRGRQEEFRYAVEREVAKRMAKADIGVTVLKVNMKIEPPAFTKRAFREVVDAEQDKKKETDKAKAYADKVTAEAEALKVKLKADARAYNTETISRIKAQKDSFLKILEKYKESPKSTLVNLYTDALSTAVTSAKGKYIINKSSGKQEVRLKLSPEHLKKDKKNEDSK